MLNLKHLELKDFVAGKIADFSLVKKALSVALGIAISRKATLPTSKVDIAQDFFNINVRSSALEKICAFNEQVIIDVDLTEQIVRSFWLIRYNAIHPNGTIPLVFDKDATFLDKLYGSTPMIAKDVLDMCDKNADLMIVIINKISVILGDVNV